MRRFLNTLEVGLTALWNALRAADRWLAERGAELEAAGREAAALLEAAADVLRDPERRQEVLDRLLAVGIARAQEAVRAVPGFDLQPADWRAHELAVAAAAFTMAFNLARPVFDAALAVLAPQADGLGDVVSAAASLPDLVRRLGDKAAQLITDAANDAMNALGLSLPKELSVSDIVGGFRWVLDHSSVVRDALGAALTAAEAEAATLQRKQQAMSQRNQARQAHSSAAEGLAAAVGHTIEIRIRSPLPFDPGSPAAPAWTYGREVPVVIEVTGATPAFVDPAQPHRLFVAVNGVPVNVHR